MPALCLPEYTRRGNTHTHTHIRIRITGGIGFHLARFASNSKLVLLQILLPDVSKVSERKTDTPVFVIRHETSISLSLSLYFVSRYHVQREQISGLLFPLKHVSDLM